MCPGDNVLLFLLRTQGHSVSLPPSPCTALVIPVTVGGGVGGHTAYVSALCSGSPPLTFWRPSWSTGRASRTTTSKAQVRPGLPSGNWEESVGRVPLQPRDAGVPGKVPSAAQDERWAPLGEELCEVGVRTRSLGISLAYSARQRVSSTPPSF